MSFIVMTRNPITEKIIVMFEDEAGNVAEFETKEEAIRAGNAMPIFKTWGVYTMEIGGLNDA